MLKLQGFSGTVAQIREAVGQSMLMTGLRIEQLTDGTPHLRVEPLIDSGLEWINDTGETVGPHTIDVSRLRVKLGSGLGFDGNGAIQATGTAGVTSLGGATGAVTLGPALSMAGQVLTLDTDLSDIAALAGASGLLRKTAGVWGLDTATYLTANQSITLSGEASGTGATAITVTLANSAVIGKVLTGYVVGANTALAATDTILGAFQKVQGQLNAKSNTGHTHAISDITYTGLTTGTVLRATGATTAAFGALDLTITASTTGALRVDRGGTGLASYTTGNYLVATGATTLAQQTPTALMDAVGATRTLTLSGTAGEIEVTGGGQTLAANRTWTIGLPNDVDITTSLDVGTVTGITAATMRVGGDIRSSGTIYASDFVLVGGAGGGSGIALNDLSDVTVSGATTGQYLRKSAGDWVASDILTADLGSGTANTTTFLRGDRTWAVASLVGVLDDLTDVVITTPAVGHFLRHNGTNWVNTTDGSTLTSINASNLSSGTLADARLSNWVMYGRSLSLAGSLDLNNYNNIIGLYYQNSDARAASGTNYPSDQAGQLTVGSSGETFTYQTYHEYRSNQFWFRSYYNGTWYSWRAMLHSGNYNSYAPTLTGTNATGTWGISITGNAATVTNGVYTTGSYADPTWITSLAATKLTGTVASARLSGVYSGVTGLGTQTQVLTGQARPAVAAITSLHAWNSSFYANETNVGSYAGYAPAFGQATVYTSGYRSHMILGSYRTASGWGGGPFLSWGGADANATEVWQFSSGGGITHSSGLTFLHSGNYGSYALPLSGGSLSGALAVSGDLTVDTSTLKVDSANNRVGIGTASPSHPFQVGTSSLISDASGNLGVGGTPEGRLFVRTDGGTGRAATFYSPSTTNGAVMRLSDNNSNFSIKTVPSGGATSLVFSYANDSVERARITAGGEVGIGTSSPTALLHVNGTFLATGAATVSGDLTVDTSTLKVDSANNRVGIGTASPDFTLTVGTPGTTVDTTIQIASSTTTTGNLFFGDAAGAGTGSFAGFVQYDHSGNSMRFGTASTERARITSGGEVGIGTSSPTALLHVNGTFLATGAARGGTFYAVSDGYYAYNSAAGVYKRLIWSNTNYTLVYRQDNNIGIYLGGGADPNNYYDNNNHYFRDASGNLRLTIAGATGNVTATGTVTATNWILSSDKRLKRDIEPIRSALSIVRALPGVHYWHEENRRYEVGFVAQDWAATRFADETTTRDDRGFYGMFYDRTIPVLWNAVREQDTEVEALKRRVAALEAEVAMLKGARNA